MDTTLQAALRGKPAMRRMLLEQCAGEWDRVVVLGPGEFKVYNNATRASEARRKAMKAMMEEPPRSSTPVDKAVDKAVKKAPQYERVPHIEPPAWRPLVVERVEPEDPPRPAARVELAPRPEPRTTERQRMKPASAAELQALGHLLQQRHADQITPGTNIVHTVDREERARERAASMVWSDVDPDAPKFDWSQVSLDDSAHRFLERFRNGLPASISFGYLPDVAAMYIDFDAVEAALRHPDRVEIRPESFHKNKGYPILGFFRGDCCTILGLREPHRPTIIAAYMTSLLEHDTHRVNHVGGGGSKKVDGTPRNPKQLLTRLRGIGCEVTDDGKSLTAEVTYRGQPLGSISVGPNTSRAVTDSDWNRMQRKVQAIDRRAHAS